MSPLNPKIQSFLKSTWPSRLTSALILMLMGWWAFANVMPIFEEKKEITAPVQIVNKTKTPKKSSLNTLNLFGNAEKNAAINKTSEAKQTKLAFILRGILATDDPKQGVAQIQNEKSNERHFVVGDNVFGQATLEEIYVDRVILLHNGRYETLLLPEEFLNIAHFESARKKQEMKKVATNYRELFTSRKTSELIKLFGFDTAWKNGGFVGFIVKALGAKGLEMMKTLGVEDGDLITAVNGKRFSETLEASQSLLELKTATSFDVIIERNGTEYPMHFDLDAPVDEYADLPEGVTREEAIKESAIQRGLAIPKWTDTEKGKTELEKARERTAGSVREEVEYDH